MSNCQEQAGGYGTREQPLAIEQARAKIREDFVRFVGLVKEQVAPPEGHTFADGPAFDLNEQMKWFLGCEVLSSDAGLSIFGHRTNSDPSDELQLRIEVRYFHPELHYRPTKRSKPRISRQYNPWFSAHIWVDQGLPYFGKNKSILTGSPFINDMPSPEALAAEVVKQLRLAFQVRSVSQASPALAA